MTNVKVSLAEGFDLGKRAELEEKRADAMQQGWMKSSDRDVAKLKAAYQRCYTTYIECLEKFNAVRRNTPDLELQKFCADKMTEYMAKCERVKERETNILLPATVSMNAKQGYVIDQVLFERRPERKLGTKEEIYHEVTVGEGAYYVNVKYLDSPSVASPTILAQVVLETARGKTIKYHKHLPAFTQWSRNIGVSSLDAPARLRFKLTSNSWIRSLQLHVVVESLKEAADPSLDMLAPPMPPYAVPRQGNDNMLDVHIPTGPVHAPPEERKEITIEELESLCIPPVEGPGWDVGYAPVNPRTLPPPPKFDLTDLSPPEPLTEPLDAVLRAVGDCVGSGSQVPQHSACPESMMELRRVSGSVSSWPSEPKNEELANFLNTLPPPTELDPPS
eukprot:TRINITY_DN30340_c0_g1_i1.p1 TRINITY_DN30340_c0_g1~~TRINITY_DN30340_c0_g1_i1.p1  ORF type:complete len:390 (+),score=78.24 TRINITY_DN30340_c0_g1_i1:48-1217(+)